jgi:tryptophan synthase alpha chain
MTSRSNRLSTLTRSKRDILAVYLTAGYPQLTDTLSICKALQESGVDMIEIGFPFSDPVADGPVIQRSSEEALKNGMSLTVLFEQLKELRKEVTVPVVLMGYLNPVLAFGVDAFCSRCNELGIDGVIIPDLPLEEYTAQYKAIFDRYNLASVLFISPTTPEERIRTIDSLNPGFVYAVSSPAVTGGALTMDAEKERYFKRIQDMHLTTPVLIGFGIADQRGYHTACKYSSGAIVGSAFISLISARGVDQKSITSFVQTLRA